MRCFGGGSWTSPPEGVVLHSGVLLKRHTKKFTGYAKGYFEVRGRYLVHYAKEKHAGARAKGHLDLCGARMADNSDGAHGFFVSSYNKTDQDYALQALTEEAKAEWSRVLVQAITAHTNEANLAVLRNENAVERTGAVHHSGWLKKCDGLMAKVDVYGEVRGGHLLYGKDAVMKNYKCIPLRGALVQKTSSDTFSLATAERKYKFAVKKACDCALWVEGLESGRAERYGTFPAQAAPPSALPAPQVVAEEHLSFAASPGSPGSEGGESLDICPASGSAASVRLDDEGAEGDPTSRTTSPQPITPPPGALRAIRREASAPLGRHGVRSGTPLRHSNGHRRGGGDRPLSRAGSSLGRSGSGYRSMTPNGEPAARRSVRHKRPQTAEAIPRASTSPTPRAVDVESSSDEEGSALPRALTYTVTEASKGPEQWNKTDDDLYYSFALEGCVASPPSAKALPAADSPLL
eukprot:TRINITY_DN97_c1_g2_i1.p1 TRINITY_DN97_c1_g2~~TRINITY_DN97_c1_g2_i1.p1  ORF type:complete len:463 (+),score=134.15 TRINITY_DN97_c1_g2_i1:31-1419(+)